MSTINETNNQHFYTNTTTHPDSNQQTYNQQQSSESRPLFFVANGSGAPQKQQTKPYQTPSPPTPDTPPLSQHGSHHSLHRNGSSGDLNLHKLQRFFRRTLKRTKEYTCRYQGQCVVDRYERNSCRYCRFKRCLDVGMDPKAVRPDRDAAGRSHPIRHRRSRISLGELANFDDEDPTDEWIRKLPVDMRTLLMQIMNVDLTVNSGDTHSEPSQVYPLQLGSLRQILEDPTLLDGKRIEMDYTPYRRVKAEEMVFVAHRRLIAVIDMVDHLCVLMDIHNVNDRLALVKAAYAPLTLFCTVAATAKTTKDRDIFCLCCCGYIARGTALRNYEEPYHFTNRIVERALDELVEPFRAFNFKDQEIALMKAIVTLNPHIRTLSTEAAEQVADMRDRIQETLYNVVRESHPKEVASSRFGNLLLFLPNIMLLGSTMYENLQFLQSFSQRKVDPLLVELIDNLEPIQDNGANVDDILSVAGSGLRSSQSNSSLSSMGSHDSSYQQMNGNSQQNGQVMSDDYYARRQSADSCIPLSTSAPTSMSTSFLTNGIQQQDSDPDYNLTLTAETFSGMRQAIVNSMEIDHVDQNMSDFYNQQPPSQQLQQNGHSSSQQQQQQQKPRFYIDSYNQPQHSQHQGTLPQVHTTIGAKHIFTVQATNDPSYSINNSSSQQPTLSAFQNAQQSIYTQPELSMNPPQPSLSKSQSFPYFMPQFSSGYQNLQQQNGHYEQQR